MGFEIKLLDVEHDIISMSKKAPYCLLRRLKNPTVIHITYLFGTLLCLVAPYLSFA